MGSIKMKMALAALGMAVMANVPGAAMANEPVKTPELEKYFAGEHYSGYVWATPETRALQDDDFSNPGMIWVDTGIAEWSKKAGKANKSCQDCHGDVENMKGVAVQYPMMDEKTNDSLINLEMRIQRCQTDNQQTEKPWKWESDQLLGMTALVTMQSRDLPVQSRANDPDPDIQKFMAKGKEFYYTRRGQLDLACKHCHEDNPGNLIRAETLSQGQTNGFPTYRLKWQKLGSLHRRFRGCNDNIRAAKLPNGSPEYLALELYLRDRGVGLPIEGPDVRK